MSKVLPKVVILKQSSACFTIHPGTIAPPNFLNALVERAARGIKRMVVRGISNGPVGPLSFR